ncbi:MAG: glutathione S-transferase N-terminal domain-containing protein [Cryobacterium sp.]|nr:glutathione S-transferase N-terminal domain-containing protein [Oligoflexia bacterium]
MSKPNETKADAVLPVLFFEEGTCSLAAMISLLVSGIPFQTCRLEEDDSESPEYLKLNALGEVPMLYRNGSVLTENVAVLQSIAASAPDSRLSFRAGSAEFDQLHRALGFLSSDFHKSFMGFFAPEAFHPDEKIQKEITKNVINGPLKGAMKHVDEHVLGRHSETPFIFDHLMIADAYLFAMARWSDDLYDIGKEFPNLKKFQNAMAKEPAVKLALEIESGHFEPRQNFKGNLKFAAFVKTAAKEKSAEDSSEHSQEKKNPGTLAAEKSVLSSGR